MEEKIATSYDMTARIKYGTLCLVGSVLCFFVDFTLMLATYREYHFRGDLAYAFGFAVIILSILGTILILIAYNFIKGKVQKQPISNSVLIFASLVLFALASFVFLLTFIFGEMPLTLGGLKAISFGSIVGFALLWHVYKRRKSQTTEKLNN